MNDAQVRIRRSIVEADEGGGDDEGRNSPQIPRSQSGMSVKSKKSIPSQKSTSRTSIDEQNQLQDLPEGSESEDSETATEVDVSHFFSLVCFFLRLAILVLFFCHLTQIDCICRVLS